MRSAQVKCLVHGSGIEVPLLCFSQKDNPPVMELIIPAMPFIADDSYGNFIRYFLKGNLDETVDRIQFDLTLRFGNDAITKHFPSLYVQEGVITLLDRENGEILAIEKYKGIYPSFRFHFTFHGKDENNFTWLEIKNRFAFRHPDDASQLIEFEFKMPFMDLLTYSDFDHAAHTKRFRLDQGELRYVEVTLPAKSRNKLKAEPGKTLLLQKGDKFVNQQAQMVSLQSSKITTVAAGNMAASRLTAVNKLQTGFLLADFGFIDKLQKPDLPLHPAVAAGVFNDWKNGKTIWCQDEISVVMPASGTPFASSPFRFLFRVKGLDTQGRPILESEITITLLCEINKLAVNYTGYAIKRIPPKDLSVSVAVPYTDNNGNARSSVISSSALSVSGDLVVAKFLLNNEWSRVAYAALSSDNVISRNIKLSVSYLFRVYTKVSSANLTSVSLNKIDRIQVLKTVPRAFKPTSNVFVASQNTLINAAGTSVKYETFKPAAAITAILPVKLPTSYNIVPQKQEEVLSKVDYKTDSLLYNNDFELSFPCIYMGEYYQEEKNGETAAIGCREPYKLGEVALRLYTEMPQLATDQYKILRSTQVPNRFVIVPFRYVISRNPQTDPEPYSPSLVVYSTFDVNNPSASHAVINAILQPDIPYYTFLEIREALKGFTSYEPDLQFITAVEAEREFQWTLPESLYLAHSATVTGNLVGYSLTCAITNALTIINMIKDGRTGITGVLYFSLPDASRYSSSLLINIGDVEGPWMESPLKIEKAAGNISFENLLYAPVDIAGYYYEKDRKLLFESVNITLRKNETHVFLAPVGDGIVPQYLVHQQNSDIAEVHTYMENINCQILFINTSGKNISIYNDFTILYSLQNDTSFLASAFSPTDTPLEVMLPVPLTSYLGQRTIRYKMRAKRTADNGVIETSWQDANLANGNIIDLGPSIDLNL